jgi:hypothetical protein
MVYSLSIITASYLYERSIPCRKLSTILLKLAQNLISNTCAKTIEFINQIITSPDFLARHRQNRKILPERENYRFTF